MKRAVVIVLAAAAAIATGCSGPAKPPPAPIGNVGSSTSEGASEPLAAPSGTGPGDRDGDGILDASDLCADDPEDFDSFEDTDGCPDPDNDGDAIIDVDDLCPNDPESRNGRDDQDGCPD